MTSKKEEWNIDKDGKGTKTTTITNENGSQNITVQNAHLDWLGNKQAREIISEETRTPPKNKK